MKSRGVMLKCVMSMKRGGRAECVTGWEENAQRRYDEILIVTNKHGRTTESAERIKPAGFKTLLVNSWTLWWQQEVHEKLQTLQFSPAPNKKAK